MMVGGMRAVLFDLDGTLLDSFALITAAFREACRRVLGREPTEREVMDRWGQPLQARFQALAPDRVAELTRIYSACYDASFRTLARAFPGVEELLRRLRARGLGLGVVTSKRRRSTLRDLEAFGLLGYFATVVASEDVTRVKPAPEPVLRALTALRADPAGSWLVGDGHLDVLAGRAAGVRTIAALWGTREREALLAAAPDYVAASPEEVAALVDGYSVA
jgi:pyrophosphatase PpaX